MDVTSKEQLVSMLKGAGWERSGSISLLHSYEGDGVALELDPAEDGSYSFMLLIQTDDGECTLACEYGDKLDETLNAILDLQDKISAGNWRTLVDAIVKVCPKVLSPDPEGDEDSEWIPVQ